MSILCMFGRHRDKTAYGHPVYKGGAHVVECERCGRAMVNGEYRWHPIANTKETLARQQEKAATSSPVQTK